MEKRSKLEYEATAMLLDMVYDPTIHTFVIIPESILLPVTHFDADSLRELTYDEVTARGNKAFEDGLLS